MPTFRRFAVLCAGGLTLAGIGCAGTWDRVSAKKFREAPFGAMFNNDDPMLVLRRSQDGNDRAAAMRKLKEPKESGRPAEEQDEALQILWQASTLDPSPIVRTAAIDALGRFRDPRAVRLLIDSYVRADGIESDPVKQQQAIQTVGAGKVPSEELLALSAPVGFEPAFVTTLRSRSITALAQSNSPEAVKFLAQVASSPAKVDDLNLDRDVRAAAVRGLGQLRNKESVTALAGIWKTESTRDVVLVQNAHEGLKNLTGKDLPADPEKWSAVVQAGVELKPEPNAIQRAFTWSK